MDTTCDLNDQITRDNAARDIELEELERFFAADQMEGIGDVRSY